MCWRDDVISTRYCSSCGKEYYGDLGHRGCPAKKKKEEAPTTPRQEPQEETVITLERWERNRFPF